jgi:hypothetical protein
VEQELLTFPEHLSSPSVLSDVRVTRSLALCVFFVDRTQQIKIRKYKTTQVKQDKRM